MNLNILQQAYCQKALAQLKDADQKISSQEILRHLNFLVYFILENNEVQSEFYSHLKIFSHSEIFDHLEGGFFTHHLFTQQCLTAETFNHTKSLSNNADIINLFNASSGIFFDAVFSIPAIKSLQWVIHNLQSVDGLFFLEMEDENALSNYYSLRHQDIQKQLDKDAYLVFLSTYNLNSVNINNTEPLKLHRDVQQVSEQIGYHQKHIPLALETAHQQLISLRKKQLSPNINQTFNLKANAKIISSLYSAAALYNRDDFALSADKALFNIKLRFKSTPMICSDIIDYQWLVQASLKRLAHQWSDDLFQWLLSLSMEMIQDQKLIDSLLDKPHCESIITDLKMLYLLSSQKIFSETANLLCNNLTNQLKWSVSNDSNLLLTLAATTLKPQVIIIRGQNFKVINWQQQVASDFKPYQLIFAISNNAVGPDPLNFPKVKSVTAFKANLDGLVHQINSVDELLSYCQ